MDSNHAHTATDTTLIAAQGVPIPEDDAIPFGDNGDDTNPEKAAQRMVEIMRWLLPGTVFAAVHETPNIPLAVANVFREVMQKTPSEPSPIPPPEYNHTPPEQFAPPRDEDIGDLSGIELGSDDDTIEESGTDSSEQQTASFTDTVRLYLREIGNIKLLNSETEQEYARAIEAGTVLERIAGMVQVDWFNRERDIVAALRMTRTHSDGGDVVRRILDTMLKEQLQPALSKAYADMPELVIDEDMRKHDDAQPLKLCHKWITIINNGRQAREYLTSANLRLVVSVAKKYIGQIGRAHV